jgi:hypothetical protein
LLREKKPMAAMQTYWLRRWRMCSESQAKFSTLSARMDHPRLLHDGASSLTVLGLRKLFRRRRALDLSGSKRQAPRTSHEGATELHARSLSPTVDNASLWNRHSDSRGLAPRRGPMDEILDKLQTDSTTVERASKSKARYPRRRSAHEADS